jgi:hypothetical protein
MRLDCDQDASNGIAGGRDKRESVQLLSALLWSSRIALLFVLFGMTSLLVRTEESGMDDGRWTTGES